MCFYYTTHHEMKVIKHQIWILNKYMKIAVLAFLSRNYDYDINQDLMITKNNF